MHQQLEEKKINLKSPIRDTQLRVGQIRTPDMPEVNAGF